MWAHPPLPAPAPCVCLRQVSTTHPKSSLDFQPSCLSFCRAGTVLQKLFSCGSFCFLSVLGLKPRALFMVGSLLTNRLSLQLSHTPVCQCRVSLSAGQRGVCLESSNDKSLKQLSLGALPTPPGDCPSTWLNMIGFFQQCCLGPWAPLWQLELVSIVCDGLMDHSSLFEEFVSSWVQFHC